MTEFTDVTRPPRQRDDGATSDPGPSRTASLAATAALIVAATVGVALRVRMILLPRSLWLDEAALALNICGRSFADLLKPLDHDQAAPIGFLFIERAMVGLFGRNETALRLFPFLASIFALVLLHQFCSKNMGRWAGVIAVALAGVLPSLFYFGGELKQYSSDVAAGLLILALTSDVLRRGLSPWRAGLLAVVGMVGVWISHPSVFLLAGTGATLILKGSIDRRYRAAALMAAVSGCWLASFALEYELFLKGLQTNEFLNGFWDSAFLKFPPTSAKDLRLYPAIGIGIFESMYQNSLADVDLAPRMGVLMAASWTLGVVALYRRGRRDLLALLVLPLAFAVLGSVLHKYPLKNRLALFTAAATVPMIAGGFAGLLTARDFTIRSVGAVLLGFALLLPTMQAAQFLVERPRLHDARRVLTDVASQWRPGDIVVVDRYSVVPLLYYRSFGEVEGLRRMEISRSERSIVEAQDLAREIDRWKGRGRVWFLFDTTLPDPTNASMAVLMVLMDRAGERLGSSTSRRYSAYLYRLDPKSDTGP